MLVNQLEKLLVIEMDTRLSNDICLTKKEENVLDTLPTTLINIEKLRSEKSHTL